jgi:hypothetical protein
MGGVVRCSDTSSVSVIAPFDAWWQVKDGDVTTNNDINSAVPATYYIEMPGTGGYPGIPMFGGTTNLTTAKVSAKPPAGWLVNSSCASTKTYNSSYFLNAVPSDISVANGTLTQISNPSVSGSTFTSGGTAAYGYYWYEYDGANDLTITSAVSLTGTR